MKNIGAGQHIPVTGQYNLRGHLQNRVSILQAAQEILTGNFEHMTIFNRPDRCHARRIVNNGHLPHKRAGATCANAVSLAFGVFDNDFNQAVFYDVGTIARFTLADDDIPGAEDALFLFAQNIHSFFPVTPHNDDSFVFIIFIVILRDNSYPVVNMWFQALCRSAEKILTSRGVA
jgi:hypothetical protein